MRPKGYLAMLALITALAPCLGLQAADQGIVVMPASHGVVDSRARIEPENRMLTDRLETLLPGLMAEAGLDM